mmetsp:Transcript_16999/g.21506  ORF Transcript_16999/g.21506 Transcript_16999/m.21506 type:complete len:82 (-) Transcript_16999:521-766(-)
MREVGIGVDIGVDIGVGPAPVVGDVGDAVVDMDIGTDIGIGIMVEGLVSDKFGRKGMTGDADMDDIMGIDAVVGISGGVEM